MNSLRAELKQSFDRDGYIVIRGFLSNTELTGLKDELNRYITRRVPELPRTDVFYEDRNDESTLKQMARIKEHDALFANLICSKKWKELAEALLDDDAVPQELEWFNKPPRIGKPTPPHQDGHYFMIEPNEAVTMWLALDPADESNGCVRYIPGSHRRGIRPHGKTEVLGFSQGIVNYSTSDVKDEVPMVVAEGDLLAHHAVTIHRADGNTSDRHRRSLGLIYYAARARQDTRRLSDYQQTLYTEWQEKQKI